MVIYPPERVWWKPISGEERLYITAALLFALVTFLLMPVWHFTGRQNPTMETVRVDRADYLKRVTAFVDQHRVGEEAGVPVVAPPPGSEVYLLARTFQWYPVIRLKAGQTYRVHISSADVVHGLSLQPINMNFMVLPGYEYVLSLTPTQRGEFHLVCNEFCGLGHHFMAGKLIVE
jgi:cytochrome c oxidase subunit 2